MQRELGALADRTQEEEDKRDRGRGAGNPRRSRAGLARQRRAGRRVRLDSGTATAIALLLFLGAIGKSAQFPLHLWLPDAMEGPTPVSALIHAATMVTAGVFLVARAHTFFEVSGDAMTVVAWVGAATAFLAGTVALVQPDIKRVLAYSTISQLGYMFLALGVGAYGAALFLVITHAFFKATLFLGAGTVIHGNADNQDMRIMGRFRKYMPYTAIAFVIASSPSPACHPSPGSGRRTACSRRPSRPTSTGCGSSGCSPPSSPPPT